MADVRLLALMGVMCLVPLVTGAQRLAPEEAGLFDEASAAYENSDFATAEAKYKQIIGAGVSCGEVLYNLGNCNFRMGKLGMALLYYERARKFMPRNRNLLSNIALTESRAVDKISPSRMRTIWRTVFLWQDRLTPRELCLIMIAANAALWISLGALVVRRSRFAKVAAVLMGIVVVLSGVCYALKGMNRRGLGTAAVIAEEAEVRTGPGNYAVTFRLHDGTCVKLIDTREGWYQIGLADGKRGWIEADNVEKI